MRYDPINRFVEYEPVETPKRVSLKFPLFDDPIDLPLFSEVKEDGTMIANDGVHVPQMIDDRSEEPVEIEEINEEENTVKSSTKGSRKYVLDFFINKGLNPMHAKGLVGNLIRESNLDPKAVNPKSKALGIAQWLGDRKEALIKKYGKNPTLDQQLEFVWHELNTTHKKGLDAILNSQSVEEAAANAFGYYEFSVGPRGAIADMRKHGQDGLGAYNKGIKFAKEL